MFMRNRADEGEYGGVGGEMGFGGGCGGGDGGGGEGGGEGGGGEAGGDGSVIPGTTTLQRTTHPGANRILRGARDSRRRARSLHARKSAVLAEDNRTTYKKKWVCRSWPPHYNSDNYEYFAYGILRLYGTFRLLVSAGCG